MVRRAGHTVRAPYTAESGSGNMQPEVYVNTRHAFLAQAVVLATEAAARAPLRRWRIALRARTVLK